MPAQGNPTELRAALLFGLAYALILLAIAAVKDALGDAGLFAIAAVSGVAEVHALTLSAAQLVEAGRLPVAGGWRIVTIALLSSLAGKSVIVAALGNRELTAKVALPVLASLGAGAALLLLR